MKHQCTNCHYLFWDEAVSDEQIEITYRCSRPISKNSIKNRIQVSGMDHDVITIIVKSLKNNQGDVDTIVAPGWCEGFAPEKE